MIALVDYGAGNLASVRKALVAAGAEVGVARAPGDLPGASGIVVPGVGHFAATAAIGAEWRVALRAAIDAGTPFLGICLGMQWLFEGSDEAPGVPGLGLLPGRIMRMPAHDAGGAPLKVPHVGWNVASCRSASGAVPGLRDGAHFYFTHGYAAPVTAATAAVTTYGLPFASAVRKDRVWGVQFHPEKSGADGLAVLRAFVDAASSGSNSPGRREASLQDGDVSASMLSRRLIACLDVRDGRVVKGVRFEGLRDAGDPASLAQRYDQEGIDELVMLDVTATLESRLARRRTVSLVAARLFIPLAVGGGIRSLDDAADVIEAGADKVSLNTAALADPELITRVASRFGSQAVVVAVDAKRAGHGYGVFTHSGRVAADRDAVAWAREAESRGAGEILLTSMDADGTLQGFDTALTAAVSSAVSIPVIASGGAGAPPHFAEVFSSGQADAALAASVFHDRSCGVSVVKQYLRGRGVPVRL